MKSNTPLRSGNRKKNYTLITAQYLLALLFLLSTFSGAGQSYEIDTYNGQTVNTCSGTFYDSGGNGSNYANNENYSMTFCSSSGQYLTFDFSQTSSSLNIESGTGDTLYFYNGTTATGTPIAFLTSSDDVSFTQLMINTLSTCVTVVWHSNGSTVDGGWAAIIGCTNPPSCAGNPPAADLFGQATNICNLNNYCGTTASYYGEDLPYNLNGGGTCPTPDDGIFGGTIENNSWLSFQAVATSASFDFTVTNCSGDGIQVGIFGFNGSAFNLVSPCNLTDGSQGGTFTVTASGLTIGSTYYIMIDGNAGANCDYIIHANTGVAVVNAGPDQSICVANATMAANAPASGTGLWSTIAGTGIFANSNSPTSTVTGLSIGTNTFVWTIPSGPCQNVSDTVNIVVTSGSMPTISYATPFCTSTSTAQSVTLTGATGGTFSASPAGLTINTSTGTITPSTSTAGTYTVSYNVASACGIATTTVVINSSITPTFTIATSLCSGSTAPTLPLTSTNSINGSWSPATVSNSASGTYVFTPTSGQCAVSTSASITVSGGSAPTFTSSTVNPTCTGLNNGSITLSPISAGSTYNWVSGPVVSPVSTGNLPGGAIDERALTNLPAGTYCVDISGPSSGTTTQTLFTETFEAGISNWTLNNSIGTNIWIRNNNYVGGTCMVGGTPFSCPTIPNQPSAVTNYPTSYYLHVNATTTVPVVCGSGSSAPFPPLNANYNGSDIAADQKATINTVINTTGLSNIIVSFYWLGDGDANDYAALEYSINGGTTWVQAGAKLNNQTTWVLGTRTDPSWANQANLRFRFRWINNASSSQDPPICIDQITITGDQTNTCSSTVHQCFTLTAPSSVTPTFSALGPYCVGATAATLPTTSTNGITGTWSPSSITTAAAGTTVYTFTPTAGLCASSTTMSVTVNANTIPTFTALGPYCVGATAAALPTTSTNGVTGTWSPSSISTATAGTTAYTFTPTAGLCATTASMSVTVNANTTPAFTALGPYCVGATPAALPTTSTNGVTGTWSPSAINTATAGTTVYTFTPTAGLCAPTTSMSVIVNANTIPTFTALGPYCVGATPATLPTTSTNGITGTWSPASISTGTAGSTVYTFTPTAGLCATTKTMTVVVNANTSPTFTALGPYCVGATAAALPTTSTNGVTGTWSPSSISTATAGTTVYTFTPTAGLCATTASMSVTVNANTTPTFTALGPYCVGATPAALPTTSTNGVTGTWSPSAINTATAGTTVYTFTPTAGLCAPTTSMSVIVNANTIPTFTALGPYCVGATPAALPTTSTNGITGTWSPTSITTAAAGTTVYTFTPTAGLCASSTTMSVTVNANTIPTFTALGPYCVGATAATLPTTSTNGITGTWSPSSISTGTAGSTVYTFTPTAGLCATTKTMTVVVNANTTPTFTALGPYCVGATPAALPTTSTNGVTGTWSPSAISTATAGTTVYTFTPTAGLCAPTASMSVTVNANTIPTFTALGPYCVGATPAALPTTSTNGITGTWSPASISTGTAGSTVYTFSPTAGLCATTKTMMVVVNANTTPTFTALGPYCVGATPAALPTTSTNGINGTWSPASISTGAAGSTVYTFTPTAGLCATTKTMTVVVNANTAPTFTALGPYCVGATPAALPTTSTNGVTGTWSPSSISTATAGTTVYTFTPTAGLCATTTTMSVVINANDNAAFNYSPSTLCSSGSDGTANITGGSTGTFTASPGGLVWLSNTNGTIDVSATTLGTYTITFTTSGVCPSSSTANVTITSAPSASISYSGPYCQNGTDPLPTYAAGASAGTFSSGAGLVFANTSTGLVDLSASSPGSYTITNNIVASGGCPAASASANIVINANPVVTADASPSIICVGASSVLTASGADSYAWSNGLGAANPVNVTPIVTSSYTVTGTTNGCSGATNVAVTVNPIPVVTVNPATPNICMGSSATLTASGASTYQWNPASTLSASTGSPVTAQPVITTVYTVIGTTNGCTASQSATVTVYSTLNISVNPASATICPGSSVSLTANGAQSYSWTPPTGLSSAVGYSVSASPASTTTYTVTGSDASGCTGTNTAVVSLFTDYQLNFTATPKVGCVPLYVEFEFIPDGIIDTNSLIWNFDDPLTTGDVSNLRTPSYTYTREGDYVVTLYGISNDGCNTWGYDTIKARQTPVADFMFHPEVAETDNPLVDFYDQSSHASHWYWDFGNPASGNSNYSMLQFPSHYFSDSGSFTTQLIVTNNFNCSDTAVKTIRINESYVFFMPNAFTPNSDGLNETFLGKGLGINENEFDMYVYDRWGEELYHGTDLFQGWDGRQSGKSEYCEQGIYVWQIRLTDKMGIEHKLTGTVMLVR